MRFSVKWLGHASFQIKADKKSIYIDPYVGEYKDKAALVLATHSHHDHLDLLKMKEIQKDDTLVIAPEDCVTKVEGKIKTLKPGEKVTIGNMTVEAVEAYNFKRFRSSGIPFHPKGLGVGYLITIGNKTIYHAGDTDFILKMKKLKNIYLALLPSGGLYTMDNEEAAEATLTVKPKVVIPMHRKEANPDVFKSKVEAQSNIRVVVLKPEEQFEVRE